MTELKHEEVADIVEDYLMHYGVKGMKWGRRRGGSSGGSGRPNVAKRAVRAVKDDIKEEVVKKSQADADTFKALKNKDNLNLTGKAINVTNRLTMGKKLTEKFYDAQIDKYQGRADRISAGKASFGDKLAGVMELNDGDLRVQKRSR